MAEYQKAEPLCTQALKQRKEELGEDHPDYAESLSNIVLLYASIGAYEKAVPLCIQALQIRKEVLGTEHPEYIQSLTSLAGFVFLHGDL